MSEPLRMEVVDPRFFSIPLKRVEIEAVPATGRTYFIFRGKIVAVALRRLDVPQPAAYMSMGTGAQS